MPNAVHNEAAKPNPALEPFRVLVGTWKTEGTHPMVPGKTFHGRTTFEWLEGGAFVIMRSQIDEPEIPSGIAIVGSDSTTGECAMIYFDERGVSRHYAVSLSDGVWKWWRDASDLSQRFTGTIAGDGRTIVGRGEMSKQGGRWEPDLQLTYTRVQ